MEPVVESRREPATDRVIEDRPSISGPAGAPIRVLYVMTTLDVGGAEGQFALLAERLDRRRFDVMVITLGDESALARRLRDVGIPVVALRVVTSAGWHPFRLLAAIPRVLAEVRHFRPAIVHGVLIHGYLLGGFAARFNGVPVLISSRRALSSAKTRFRPLLILEQWVNRFTRVVIANSEAVRQDAIRAEGLPAHKVRVIWNGIVATRYSQPVDESLRVGLELQYSEPVIAIVSNFIRYKGHAHFLRAFAALAAEHTRATAILIGDGPERRTCEALVSDLQIADKVRFLGQRPDVPRLLQLADIVVHPSLTEGFSNAILEAMAAGKPVIATNVGGNPEAVTHGVTGYIVTPADADALLAPMRLLSSDRTLRESMGAAGRQRIASSFSIEGMIQRYEDCYREVVEDSLREAMKR